MNGFWTTLGLHWHSGAKNAYEKGGGKRDDMKKENVALINQCLHSVYRDYTRVSETKRREWTQLLNKLH